MGACASINRRSRDALTAPMYQILNGTIKASEKRYPKDTELLLTQVGIATIS